MFYLYTANFYSRQLFATIGVLQAVMGLVTTFFTFGLNQTVQHFISSHMARGEKDVVRFLLRRIIILTVILSTGSFLTIFFLSPALITIFLHATGADATNAHKAIFFLSLASAGAILSNILNFMLLGFQRFKTNGFLVVLNAIAVYGSAAFLLSRFGTPQAVTAGWTGGYFFMIIVNLIFLTRAARSARSDTIRSISFRPIFRYTFPILLASIEAYGSVYADRLVVAGLIGPTPFAVYSFALLVTSSVVFFVSPINNILLPKFSEYFAFNDPNSIRRGIRLTSNVVTFIYTPAALWISVLAVPILLVLAKSGYVGGAIPLGIILTISAIFITQTVLVQGLQGIRITSIFILSSGLSFLSNLILSILLIPRFGLIGAALGYSSVNVVNFIVIYHFAKQNQIISYDTRTMGKIWISSIIMLLSIFVFNQEILPLNPFTSFLSGIPRFLVYGFYLLLYIVIGILVYAASLRALKTMKREDIDFFYTFMPEPLKFTKRAVNMLFVSRSRR